MSRTGGGRSVVTRTGDSSRRVWILIGVTVSLAGALTAVPAWRLGGPVRGSSWPAPWLILSAGFAVAELFPAHLQVRRHAWSASLVEIPLVVGLILASPGDVVVGQLLGCLVARGLINRQPLQKLAFNSAMVALESAVAVTAFSLLGGGRSVNNPVVWAAAYLAVLLEGALSTVGLAAVMRIVTGALPADLGANFLLGAVAVPTAATSVALEGVMTARDGIGASVLLGVIVALLGVGYRAYGRLRARYGSLQLLYRFTDAVQSTQPGDDAVDALLAATTAVLDAEIAELTVADGSGRWLHRSTGNSGPQILDGPPASWTIVASTGSGIVASGSSRTDDSARWLDAAGWDNGMVVPLQRDGVMFGTLAVANREGEVATFDNDSLLLFEALANHAAISIRVSELITRLTFDASHDALTELPNRLKFHRQLDEALTRRPPGHKIAVALIDLDEFKEINDTLGHHTGDQLLAWLGRRVAAVLPPEAVVARLGGDEFAVFLSYEGTKAAAVAIVDSFLRPLWDQPFRWSDVDIDVRASVGVSVAPDDGEDTSTLLQHADVAMYSAKAAGSGRPAAYSPERDTNSAERLALAAELRTAIANGDLKVCFQPQVDLATGKITAAEALVRWEHPKHGPISPEDFIPLSERTGLIVPLTRMVLERALEACIIWETTGLTLSVAVNVSVRSLADETIVATVADLLRRHHVPAERLTLEVTESGVMEDERRNVGVLEALASLGVRLAVDDFGTGYSSLAYLKRLPVHEVKIDKSFVFSMHEDPKDAAIVRSVLDLARHLGLSVVAEGVESASVMDTLRGLGCSVAQGYYVGRPVDVQGLATMAVRWNSSPAVASGWTTRDQAPTPARTRLQAV
jgi:diguanylate cyclase (GGDEF)-like protein